jgi:hypothetical protein
VRDGSGILRSFAEQIQAYSPTSTKRLQAIFYMENKSFSLFGEGTPKKYYIYF